MSKLILVFLHIPQADVEQYAKFFTHTVEIVVCVSSLRSSQTGIINSSPSIDGSLFTCSSASSSTGLGYESACRLYIIPNLGQVRIRNLRPDQIQNMYNTLLEDGVGRYTIRKVHTVLHSALQHASKTSIINSNPAMNTQPPREPDKEMAILDESQVSQLLVAADGHRWKALYHLAIISGMRQMELLGLKWTDVDWVRSTIKVERQLLRSSGNGIEFSRPKTRYGKRSIDLGNKSIEVLRNHYEYQQKERQTAGEKWVENGLIFTALLKEAGLVPIRFHDLRHTAASLLLNQGIPVLAVSRRLGHARASITLDIYGHLIPSMQSEIAKLIDELVIPIPVDLADSKINT